MAIDEILLEAKLPFPPSINHYWRRVTIQGRPRTLISEAGRKFRVDVVAELLLQKAYKIRGIAGRLHVRLHIYPPDRRKRDIDNYVKSTLDAMTHAGVWLDDEQIDRLDIYRGAVRTPGYAVIQVYTYAGNGELF